MARPTHILEIHGTHTYPASDVENRQLPELQIELDYMGWDENRVHFFEGRVKILDAGDLFLKHLPAKLKKLKATDLDIEATNKRVATKEAMEWADELVGEFLASGMFSRATVDARGIDKGVYEYEPQLKVTGAKVYKVKS